MIIGDNKIKMCESDFIELATRLGNNKTCVDPLPCKKNNCENRCSECWSKYLKAFIVVD